MFKAEVNAFTLVAAVLAATLARFSPDAGWTMLVVGCLLTAVMFGFDHRDLRVMWQSIAFGGVVAYGLVIAALGALVLGHTFWPQSVPWPLAFYWQPIAWVGMLIVLVVIDRVRMESRAPSGLFTQHEAAPASVPHAVKAAIPTPVPLTAAPRPIPETAPPFKGVAVKPVELPPNAGKPATIYLNIIGAGLSCLRAVKAEHLGRDFYRIVEPTPADEKWEFGTGQVVRCQKRTLSSGKALVAVEEAPRVNPS